MKTKKKPPKNTQSLNINQETNCNIYKSSLSAFINIINICLLRNGKTTSKYQLGSPDSEL